MFMSYFMLIVLPCAVSSHRYMFKSKSDDEGDTFYWKRANRTHNQIRNLAVSSANNSDVKQSYLDWGMLESELQVSLEAVVRCSRRYTPGTCAEPVVSMWTFNFNIQDCTERFGCPDTQRTNRFRTYQRCLKRCKPLMDIYSHILALEPRKNLTTNPPMKGKVLKDINHRKLASLDSWIRFEHTQQHHADQRQDLELEVDSDLEEPVTMPTRETENSFDEEIGLFEF